jgi:hypothetical protein
VAPAYLYHASNLHLQTQHRNRNLVCDGFVTGLCLLVSSQQRTRLSSFLLRWIAIKTYRPCVMIGCKQHWVVVITDAMPSGLYSSTTTNNVADCELVSICGYACKFTYIGRYSLSSTSCSSLRTCWMRRSNWATVHPRQEVKGQSPSDARRSPTRSTASRPMLACIESILGNQCMVSKLKFNFGTFAATTASVRCFGSVTVEYRTHLNANLLWAAAYNEPERLGGPPLPQAP